jgi:hypothetical protein
VVFKKSLKDQSQIYLSFQSLAFLYLATDPSLSLFLFSPCQLGPTWLPCLPPRLDRTRVRAPSSAILGLHTSHLPRDRPLSCVVLCTRAAHTLVHLHGVPPLATVYVASVAAPAQLLRSAHFSCADPTISPTAEPHLSSTTFPL